MKIPIARLVIHSFTALMLFLGTYFLYIKALHAFSLPLAFSIFSIFGILNAITEWYYFKIHAAEKQSYLFKVIILRGFKFLFYLILTLVVIKVHSQNQTFFGLFIVALFFLYTVLEFTFFIKYKKS